uniref:proline--tRNA ligase n=1 Tax=Aceria tosichella TaxID=561515 RepID=A0A6G1S670_9ACAR
MFPVQAGNIRRVSFATQLFPRINSSLNLETSPNLRADADHKADIDGSGGPFCGGRSRNKDLLTLFGFISDSQRGASTYAQLPLFRRSIRKLTQLVERELESVGAHEVLLPTLIPQKLWQQSKRLDRQQDALEHVYSFKDNANNELLLGPTFEESITQLMGDLDPPREQELPLLLYQTSSKFRYEPNPRFGLIRSNEFLMNDLYSFDISLDAAKRTYDLMTGVYERIFGLLDLPCLRFESDPGSIGGKYSHEYQLPVSSGEDHVIQCQSCSYSFNAEMCKQVGEDFADSSKCIKCSSQNIRRTQTLELAHTFLLSDTYSNPLKAHIKRDDGTKVNYQMGCFGLGLTRILGAGLDLYSLVPGGGVENEPANVNFIQMRWPSQVEPYKLGIVSPARRSKQFNAGSTIFIEGLTRKILESTRDVDVLIEDRDKDGIFKRLAKLQSLGIPNIIVVGQRFLHDTPEVEILSLSSSKKEYDQHWMTEDQAVDFVQRLENDK